MIGLTLESIKAQINVLKKQEYDEPVPSFEEADITKLLSALKTPFLRESFGGKSSIVTTSSHLFCSIIQNHCFPNGNKRIAVYSLRNILNINDFDINIGNVRLYGMAMGVTWLSKYRKHEEAIEEVSYLVGESIGKKKGRPAKKSEIKRLSEEFESFMSN